MAVVCAEAWQAERNRNPNIPPLQLLMVLTEEPEPPAVLQKLGQTPTFMLEIGHKGKYVGVVGIFKQPGGDLKLKYELVRMEPIYQPREGQTNRVLEVLEEYARNVKSENLLTQFIRAAHPTQVDPYVQQTYGGSSYVGSERCGKCHRGEHKTWQATHHAGAFETLVQKAKNPSLRQYDPECVVCHTVGFKHPEGYNDLPRGEMQDLIQKRAGGAAIQAAIAAQSEVRARRLRKLPRPRQRSCQRQRQ